MILGLLEHVVTRWLLKGEKYDLMKYYEEVCTVVFQRISLRKRLGK
jgi:hypothetical protein